MDALILIGGFGTRLRPLTFTTAKNILPIANKSLLERIIESITEYVDRIILSMGYKSCEMKERLDKTLKEEYKKKLIYVEEKKPLGTLGAIKFSEEYLSSEFLVLNGDVLSDVDFDAFLAFHRRHNPKASIVLAKVEDPTRFGVAVLSGSKIVDFVEKPENPISYWINAGVYLLKKELLKSVAKDTYTMIERDLFPALSKEGSIYGYLHDSFWIDTGTPKTYIQANTYYQEKEDSGKFTLPFNIGNRVIKVKNMKIGPYVSIGKNCRLNCIEISHSIVFDNVTTEEGCIIKYSTIGYDTRIEAHTLIKKSIIGDNVVIRDNVHVENSKVCPHLTIKEDVFDSIRL